LKVDNFNYKEVCAKIAGMAEGLSGREISKLGVSWQAAAYASENGILTEAMVMERVNDIIRQHKQRMLWEAEEESSKRVSIKDQQNSIVM